MLIGIYSQRNELKQRSCKPVGRDGKQKLMQG